MSIGIDLTSLTSFAMAQNSDTQTNFIKWHREVFGFSNQVATALYDDQLFQSPETIAEFGDSEIDNVCRTLRRDSSLPIAELAVTRLKLLAFWVRHQHRTGREIGGVQNPLVRTELATLNQLKDRNESKTVGLPVTRSPSTMLPLPLTLPRPLRLLKR